MNGQAFSRGAFPRKFLKEEMVRVPTGKDGKPLAATASGQHGVLGVDTESETEEEDLPPPKTKPKIKLKPVIVHPPLKVGATIKVRFYNTSNGARPYTEDAYKRKVGKQKQWYQGEVKKINKDKNEYSVYFEVDRETVVLNLSDTGAKDYVKEGRGWQKV